jgi:hypothetical protein
MSINARLSYGSFSSAACLSNCMIISTIKLSICFYANGTLYQLWQYQLAITWILFYQFNIDIFKPDSESCKSRRSTFATWQSKIDFTVFIHRYLMTRLSLQVVYLWRHVTSTAPSFILWWPNFEILFYPLHRSSPFIGELRCHAIQMEQGLI